MSQEKHIIIAKIGAPHGVRGDLKLNTFTENPQALLGFDTLLIETKNNLYKPLPGYQIKKSGSGFLISFDAYSDRDKARVFVNKHLAILRSQLPEASEDDGIYWSDLEGLSVQTLAGDVMGTIDYLFDTGSNDVVVVQPEGDVPSILIPYVDAHVLNVDLEQGVMTVDWDPNFE